MAAAEDRFHPRYTRSEELGAEITDIVFKTVAQEISPR